MPVLLAFDLQDEIVDWTDVNRNAFLPPKEVRLLAEEICNSLTAVSTELVKKYPEEFRSQKRLRKMMPPSDGGDYLKEMYKGYGDKDSLLDDVSPDSGFGSQRQAGNVDDLPVGSASRAITFEDKRPYLRRTFCSPFMHAIQSSDE